MGLDIDQLRQAFSIKVHDVGMSCVLRQSTRLKKAKSIGDADVFRYDLGGVPVLIKSYKARPWLVRRFFGQWCINHEYEMLNKLVRLNIGNVPFPLGRFDGDTLVLEYLEQAQTLQCAKRYTDATLPSREFFKKLIDAFRLMHGNNLAHGDLRRGNIMIGGDGNPHIIDVATSCYCPDNASFPKRFVFRVLSRSDNYSLARIVDSYYPELLDDELRKALDNVPWYLHLGRFLRQRIYGKYIKHHHAHSKGEKE